MSQESKGNSQDASGGMTTNPLQEDAHANGGEKGANGDTSVDVRQQPSLFDDLSREETPVWKQKLTYTIDGPAGSLFFTVVTIWALIGDDIRLICTYKEDDDIFVGFTIFCLVCFCIELAIASVAKRDFFLGFYFWLDLIATSSLLLDIPSVVETLTGVEETDSTAVDSSSTDSNNVQDSGKLTKASRTSRAGARAGRIVRLVRLFRIVKLYKKYVQFQAEKANQKTSALKDDAFDDDDEEEDADDEAEEEEQSRVGQTLSELTTRRVIIGVLCMLFGLQLFDSDTWVEPTTLIDGGLALVVETFDASGVSNSFYSVMDSYADQTDTEISTMYWIVINGTDYSSRYGYLGAEYRRLRESEWVDVTYGSSFARFTTRVASEYQAILNLFKTIFICIVLGFGAMMFSQDANTLVLKPLERIFKKVREISENPLKRDGDQIEEEEDDDDSAERFETKILEDSFSKICSLMAVGFGEAGAEIIAENMTSAGAFNPMVKGRKMVAIFGFCDIRQFTDATEVLQEGVMEFVNSIAQIVHMEVSLHGGSANKNIGDAFLLVWKFPPEVTLELINQAISDGPDVTKGAYRDSISQVADKALATFVVTIAMLKKSARLRAYGQNPVLNERMPNYSVKMGFGLHVGWAIEGAIGSTYKVDASYLSPNVNMASRLEAATKQFGASILLSENFARILKPSTYARCRQIDRVTVKGSVQPMGLFTYDVEVDNLAINPNNIEYSKEPERFTLSKGNFQDEFAEHPDIIKTRGASPQFLRRFGEAFAAYESGSWPEAHKILLSILVRKRPNGKEFEDGPSNTLLRVMGEYDFQAPEDWRGYRELTEK